MRRPSIVLLGQDISGSHFCVCPVHLLSKADRAKRVEPHLTRGIFGASRKKWSKKLLWRAKRAFEDGR